MHLKLFSVFLILLTALPLSAMAVTHPSLYLNPGDIENAKKNINQYLWAQKLFDTILKNADLWSGKSDEELRSYFPPAKSLFAYGLAGCPVCKTSWSSWGDNGVCNFSRPGMVKCPKCGRVFPDADHPDSGEGWKDPETNVTYYFKAIYNAYFSQRLTLDILDDLTIAYSITHEEKYAHTAAVLMDSLAILYPTCTLGSVDYPDAPGGRLERTQYQVARMLVHLSNYYDLISESAEIDKPSADKKAGTIRKNVEENLLRNGANFCLDEGQNSYMGLTNGQADYVRGVLSVGLVLGDESYTKWALEGPTSVIRFIENNLDRDGLYYEVSPLYSEHAVGLYVDIAKMLVNYKSSKYPNGYNLFEHPKLRRAMVQALIDQNCAGHTPCFGDTSPDLRVIDEPSWNPFGSRAYSFAETLLGYSKPEDIPAVWNILQRLCDGDVEGYRNELEGIQKRLEGPQLGIPTRKKRTPVGDSELLRWMLFHAKSLASSESNTQTYADSSKLLGGKGIAILRSGKDDSSRAALLRYGPAWNHGHSDDLNLNFYALGREMTYDLGYSVGSAHVQVGWTHQTASHNLVVVNEKPQMLGPGTGGSPTLFAGSPGVQVVDASSENCYSTEKISTYRRTMAMVDLSPNNFYLVDIFRVRGGDKQDQFWHFSGALDSVKGVTLSETLKGSLAGPEIDWGNKLLANGDIDGFPNKPYWNAPPQNGYGFLDQIRRGTPEKSLELTWKMDDSAHLKATLLPPEGSELVTAHGPGILPNLPGADYAILRESGKSLSSSFISVLEPYQKTPSLMKAEKIYPAEKSSSLTAVQVKCSGEREDYLLSDSPAIQNPKAAVFKTSSGALHFQGQFGFVSMESNQPRRMILAGGRHLSFGNMEITTEKEAYTGQIEALRTDEAKIYTQTPLPEGTCLVGQILYLHQDGYSHLSPYTIRGIKKVGKRMEISLGDISFTLAGGRVTAAPDLETGKMKIEPPLEQATSVSDQESNYYNGKQIVNLKTQKTSVIKGVAIRNDWEMIVKDPSLFSEGDEYVIEDAQPGDSFFIPAWVDVRYSRGKYQITSTVPVQIKKGKTKVSKKIGNFTF